MKKIGLLLVFATWVWQGWSQDLHLTQFVNNPQLYAPAQTGFSGGHLRALASYRAQWQKVPVPYRSISTAVDARVDAALPLGMYAGVGMLLHADEAGDGQLRTVLPALAGALHLPLGEQSQISLGSQLGLLHRNVDYSGFRFDNQFDGDVFQPGAETGELIDAARINLLTLSGGLNFHTKAAFTRTAVNVGWGAFHLNRPSNSFYGDADVRVPIRHSFYLEGTIQLNEKLDIGIHSLLQMQQDYREWINGALLRYYLVPDGPFMRSVGIGAFFRHGDALAPMLELQQGAWRFAFTYDFNLSAFQVATLGRGGPELHLRYLLIRVSPPPRSKICPIL